MFSINQIFERRKNSVISKLGFEYKCEKEPMYIKL